MNNKINWHIGCSGFSYREWKEVFYPKGLATGKWFEFYTGHFNTLEVNLTFYRTPKLATLLKWHDTSPPGFSFSVKAPRLITHYKKLNDCKKDITGFYDLMAEGLQEKLGCVLFQFPPSFSYTGERLAAVITQLNVNYNNVVEFRHISWWNKEVYTTLQEHRIIFCNISHPLIPENIVHTAPIFYCRFHGVPVLFKSAYSTEYLDGLLKNIQTADTIRSAWLYFNNTAGISAIENAGYIKSTLLKN